MKMINTFRISACCFLISILSGCLSPVPNDQMNHYVINTVPENLPKSSHARGTLMVMQPEAASIYNTTQMVYVKCPHQISYFGKNQWADTPMQMLQSLMVQTLQKTHYFRAVVTPPFIGNYDYALSTQILKIQQNYVYHPARFELTLRAQLSHAANGRVIASREFILTQPLPSYTPYGGVIAANRVTAELMRKLAIFTVENLRH